MIHTVESLSVVLAEKEDVLSVSAEIVRKVDNSDFCSKYSGGKILYARRW